MSYTNKDLVAARSGGDALATGLAQLADAFAERLRPRLLERAGRRASGRPNSDTMENGELILRELAALREQMALLVRHLRDNQRKARQRVGTVRRKSAERTRAAGHSATDEEKARIRKLLLR